ncbi:MAG TPA: DUF4232 domain-containing protein [Trebonia sp.]
MRAGARVGLRIATVVAFGATAALAVTLSRGAPVGAALASAQGPKAQHAAAGTRPSATTGRCALSGLRISLGRGARVTSLVTRYPLDFTNVSGAPCTLAGYPEVTAYQGNRVPVGAAAGRDRSVAARSIVLAPGQTAHATLDAAVPATRCGPVRAAGLRVVTPGQKGARYVRRPLTACTAAAPDGREFLRVRAIQAGAGNSAGISTSATSRPLPASGR